MKRRLAEVRCWSLSGFLPCRWAVRTPSGRCGGETGFLPSHCLVLFFGFCFLCSFHSNFFALGNSVFGLITVLCTLLSWGRRKSVPLSGGAVPSRRTCILLTGLLRKPRCSRGKPAGETVSAVPGCDTLLRSMYWALFSCVWKKQNHTYSDIALTAHTSFIFPF